MSKDLGGRVHFVSQQILAMPPSLRISRAKTCRAPLMHVAGLGGSQYSASGLKKHKSCDELTWRKRKRAWSPGARQLALEFTQIQYCAEGNEQTYPRSSGEPPLFSCAVITIGTLENVRKHSRRVLQFATSWLWLSCRSALGWLLWTFFWHQTW